MEIDKTVTKVIDYALLHHQEIKDYADFYIQNKQLNAQINQMNRLTDARLRIIGEKYETQRLLIERLFGERAFALRAQYETLHKGLETNDAQITLFALKAISDTIAQNPLEELTAYTKELESDSQIMKLDF